MYELDISVFIFTGHSITNLRPLIDEFMILEFAFAFALGLLLEIGYV